MDGILRSISDALLSWQLTLIAFLATSAAVLLPDRFAEQLSLVPFRAALGPWLGVIWILSASGLFVHLFQWARDVAAVRRGRNQAIGCLEFLSDLERRLLTYCVVKRQQSINLPLYYDPAKSLGQKGIIRVAGGTGNGLIWAHTIVPHVWDYLVLNWQIPERDRIDIQKSGWFRSIERGQTDWMEWR